MAGRESEYVPVREEASMTDESRDGKTEKEENFGIRGY